MKDNISDIKFWIETAKEIDKERKDSDMNLLFDIHPVELFETKLPHLENHKEISKGFFEMFGDFCKRIYDSAQYEKGSGRVVESLRSASKTLYLLDLGYEITSEYIYKFSREELKKNLDFPQNFSTAYEILCGKRDAIFRLLDPFQTIYIDLSMEKKMLEEAYKLLETFEIAKDISFEELVSKVESRLASPNDIIRKTEVKEVVYELLEGKNLLLTVAINDKDVVLLEKINKVLPDFEYSDFVKEFVEDKKLVNMSLRMFGEKVTISVPYSGGPKEIIDLLNPSIEKRLGKILLCTERFGNNMFIVTPSEKKGEVLMNQLLFETLN